jgi:hypothetical protein
MKKTDALIKKIEDHAKIFKSRAIKSPTDYKRHDLIERDEQKYMIMARAELGWSFAKIGSVFNRDPRTVVKKVQQGPLGKDKSIRQGDEVPLPTNAMPISSGIPERTSICLAPPDNIDVFTLKSWGVPNRKASAILYRWRDYHREGSHEMCQAYQMLEDDMRIRKIPYNQAEILLIAGLEAREFGTEKHVRYVELSRKYRSWESSDNYRAFLKEIDRLDK